MQDARPLPCEGALPVADSVGVSGSVTSGPGVRIALRLSGGSIAEARFETLAFDEAREAASALCAALCGRTVEEASRMTADDVARIAGRAGVDRVVRTVHFAKSSALLPLLRRAAGGAPAFVCTCFHVSAETLRRAIRDDGLATVDDVRTRLRVTGGCGTCREDVERLLAAT